ncbi:MAG: metallopeptidase family protein [Rhodospirillales bacterium]|nr:metallopeptidase family protein [Rhodospirillales bacterium]
MAYRHPQTLEEFENTASQVWDGLPALFRDVAGNLVIRIEDFAGRDTLADMGIASRYHLLGLYHGLGLPFKSVHDLPYGPDMIFLYRIPILAYADAAMEPVREVIAHVLIHEIGHHFGFSDDDMDAIEAAS